jgi:ATP-binding cassette subfamily D (ALD) protein 3
VVHKSWPEFGACLADFFVTGIAASVINSGIKFLTNAITVAFRRRLTEYVHSRYLAHRSYYRAAVLRLGNLDNADARIVEDLNQFCATAADLFSRTFKPALDVALSTQRMGRSMGYGGLTALYTYFLVSGALVRAVSPPIPRLVAEQAALEGDFRRAHARLIAHAEEVAFLEGAAREKSILNGKLRGVTAFATKLHLLQFRQGMVDQWGLKYFASVIGWPILAVPFLTHPSDDVAEVAARYREYDSLLQSASASVGDLLLVYKKLQRLSGFTARVVELLEAVETPPEAGVAADTSKALAVHDKPSILFDGVTIVSPDDRLLLKQLSLEIVPGRNIIVTGANGAGKTSMFRVLAGLWAPSEGRVTRPRSGLAGGASYTHLPALAGGERPGSSFAALPAAAAGASPPCALFYVPQRPYLVSGTLRDQVTYPLTPGRGADEAVLDCLRRVRLDKLASHSPAGLDTAHHDWVDVLSGGEKQRLGLARLYYHRPAFAVLDESTSAINPDEEGKLYGQMSELGITVFSIAHRMELMKFHQLQLHLAADGTGGWTLTPLDGAGASGSGNGATVAGVEGSDGDIDDGVDEEEE